MVKGRVSIRTGDALHFGEMSDDGMSNQILGVASSGNARSSAGIVFNSGHLTNSQSRGGNTLPTQSIKPPGKRLMTSQGPRKPMPTGYQD